jgi:hypothetical protein
MFFYILNHVQNHVRTGLFLEQEDKKRCHWTQGKANGNNIPYPGLKPGDRQKVKLIINGACVRDRRDKKKSKEM